MAQDEYNKTRKNMTFVLLFTTITIGYVLVFQHVPTNQFYGESPMYKPMPSILKRSIELLADKNKTILLTFCEYGFFDTGVNFFLTSIKRFDIKNYLFISSDNMTCPLMLLKGINCIQYFDGKFGIGKASVFNTPDYRYKTQQKIKLVLDTLNHGFNVIMSDVDIVFLKNPIPLLYNAVSTCDMAMQVDRGGGYNTGFYFVKSNIITSMLFRKVWQSPLKSKKG